MTEKQYKYILVLATEGSFSKAADYLNISQPSLSQYIKKIETKIGLELFDRSNGNIRLTDAGREYVKIGQKILDLEHQLNGKLDDLRTRKTGSLIIGTAPYRAASMMPLIAARFQSVYPGIHLVVREGTTSELADGMEKGEFDICLTMLPVDTEIFTYVKVTEEELVLAVPASTKDFSFPIDPISLNNQGFVMLTEGQFMQKQLRTLILSYNLTLKTTAVVKSLEAQIEFVKAGIGIALVPSGIKRFCNNDEIIFYPLDIPLPKREIVLMWRKNIPLSRTAEELKDLIMEIPW